MPMPVTYQDVRNYTEQLIKTHRIDISLNEAINIWYRDAPWFHDAHALFRKAPWINSINYIVAYSVTDAFIEMATCFDIPFHYATIPISGGQVPNLSELPCPWFVDYAATTTSELVIGLIDENVAVALTMCGDVDVMMSTYYPS